MQKSTGSGVLPARLRKDIRLHDLHFCFANHCNSLENMVLQSQLHPVYPANSISTQNRKYQHFSRINSCSIRCHFLHHSWPKVAQITTRQANISKEQQYWFKFNAVAFCFRREDANLISFSYRLKRKLLMWSTGIVIRMRFSCFPPFLSYINNPPEPNQVDSNYWLHYNSQRVTEQIYGIIRRLMPYA